MSLKRWLQGTTLIFAIGLPLIAAGDRWNQAGRTPDTEFEVLMLVYATFNVAVLLLVTFVKPWRKGK